MGTIPEIYTGASKSMIYKTFHVHWQQISKFARQHADIFWLGLIVILGFLIRLTGIKFGYPLLTHPDEPAIINPVVNMTVNRTLDPGSANRPDLFLIDFNFIFLNIVSLLKFGGFLGETFGKFPLYFYFAARAVIVVIGSLLPILAWKIGKEGKIDFSFPAAIFLAFFPAFVEHSHYVTPDVTITFFTLAIILFSIKYAKIGQAKYLYFATFLCALNTSEKYPGLISFALVAVAILYRTLLPAEQPLLLGVKRAILQILKFGLVFLISLFFVAPTLFIEYGRTITALIGEARTTHLGADNLGWFGNMAFYAREYFSDAKWVLALLALPGAALAVKRRDPVFIFVSYGFLYWTLLSILALHWERWALPMYTAPLLFAAYGVVSLPAFFRRLPRFGSIFRVLVVGGVGLQLFLASFSASITMTFQDTRYVALIYCQNHGITAQNSLYEAYTPFSPTLEGGTNFHEQYQSGAKAKYILLSSNMYGRYLYEPERYPRQVENYKEIRAENELLEIFSASTSGKQGLAGQFDTLAYFVRRAIGSDTQIRLSGPTIEIYQSRIQSTP